MNHRLVSEAEPCDGWKKNTATFDFLLCRPVWQLTTACGRAAPRPCGWLISTRRERAVDLLNYPEVTQRFTDCLGGWLSDFYDACVTDGVLKRMIDKPAGWQDVCQTVELCWTAQFEGGSWAWVSALPDFPARQMMLGSRFDGWLDERSLAD